MLWENVYDSETMMPNKNRLFIIHAETEKDGSTFSHVRVPSIEREGDVNFWQVSRQMPPTSRFYVEGTIDFGKGSIRNYQLRRLLYGETSSAINFRSER